VRGVVASLIFAVAGPGPATAAPTQDGVVRIATFNCSLNRPALGGLRASLATTDDPQARAVAEIIQRVRPDILLLQEFDYDAGGQALRDFQANYLARPQGGAQPLGFAYSFVAESNTGQPSGFDLDHDGRVAGGGDALGFGEFPGQYGMALFSRFPLAAARTFRRFLWRDMPGALLPTDPKTGKPYYDDDDLAALRLSSKSHWDVPISVPAKEDRPGFVLHLLCSHPTPPVFDGPEDRNGRRNHDEIRLLADYIEPSKSGYLTDDAGRRGGIAPDAMFVIVGDLNCDPVDGAGIRGAMDQLLKSQRIDASYIPASEGGPLVVKQHAEQFAKHKGDPSHVTADFTPEGHGCLRIDYVLPSRGLEITKGGIFWPVPGEAGAEAITGTDHRSVWLDIRPNTAGSETR